MAHPSQCKNLYLLQKESTSSRHSEVDWSEPDYKKYPMFQHALANEIILKPGDVLFVPGYWFHYIVSLNINFQCNCRSGTNHPTYSSVIHKCGKF
jgi:ribosomal protein L16 Arg81 hydroxylase